MAPTPVTDDLAADPTATALPNSNYWTKANIALTVVFSLLTVGVLLAVILFLFHRRAQKIKRSKSTSVTAGLLNNEDKTSMFSRDRHSSVTLYVDSETDAYDRRASAETSTLIPLQTTPIDERQSPITNNNGSTGSGISAVSRTSNATMSTMLLSPILPGEDGDMGIRPSGRPRSTSSASQKARYYDSTATNVEMPPLPKIIRTASD